MNRRKLIERLRNRDFRRAFAEEAVDVGIPIQIREMRTARGWSQTQLGKEAGMAQEQVSLAEKLSYGRFTVATLKKLAAAFDCALMVRFVSYSELLAWKDRVDETLITPPPFNADTALNELAFSETSRAPSRNVASVGATDNVVDLIAYLSRGEGGRKSAHRTLFKPHGGQATNPRAQYTDPEVTNV